LHIIQSPAALNELRTEVQGVVASRCKKVLAVSHQTGVQRMVSIRGVVCDSPQLCHHLTFHY